MINLTFDLLATSPFHPSYLPLWELMKELKELSDEKRLEARLLIDVPNTFSRDIGGDPQEDYIMMPIIMDALQFCEDVERNHKDITSLKMQAVKIIRDHQEDEQMMS